MGDESTNDIQTLINSTMDGSVTIHQRSLRALAIEMYMVSNKFSPPLMSEFL